MIGPGAGARVMMATRPVDFRKGADSLAALVGVQYGGDGLVDTPPPGGVPLLDEAQRRALAQIVESGPIAASHGVVRWRLIDLAQWVWDEFGIAISKQTLSRELRAMGYRKLSARPRHHAQDDEAIPTFKKTSPPKWRRSGQRSRATRR